MRVLVEYAIDFCGGGKKFWVNYIIYRRVNCIVLKSQWFGFGIVRFWGNFFGSILVYIGLYWSFLVY